MATRADILLEPVAKTASIVEIGASFSPIAPKREGWNTKTIDVATKSELIDKYRGTSGVDTDNIEEVDFVWRDGPLIDAVPLEHHGTFDAFIASHVIEHQPDLVAFFRCAATLLKSDGVVILAVPDKRFCFDYFKPVAMTWNVVAAHKAHRIRHYSETAFQFYGYTVSANGGLAWGQHPIENAKFVFAHPLTFAYSKFITCDEIPEYVDMHAWQFTPASFELLLLELARLKIIDWRADRISPAEGCEFHAWLRRGGREMTAALSEEEFDTRRIELLKRMMLEAKEQIEFLMPENETLRKECSALRSRLAEEAAASAKWFQAVIAVTADDDPVALVPLGPHSRWRKVARRLSGHRRRLSPIALANRARDNGEWELAVRYYRDALTLKPDESRIWVQYGHALKEARKVSEAEVACRKAAELDGNKVNTNAALGCAPVLQDKSAEAAAAYSVEHDDAAERGKKMAGNGDLSNWMIPETNATRRGGSVIPKPLLDTIQRGHMAYTYKGIPTFKNPFDWALYPMLLWEARPKTIIEVGSNQGGSAAWLADTMRAYGFACQIHSIDINPVTWLQLPDVTFHKGDANLLELSFSPDFMRSLARPLLVIEDSVHDMTTSLAVLNFFHNWLATGEYIIIEDGIITDLAGPEAQGGGPRAAVEHFIANHASEYEVDTRYCDWFGQNVTWNVNGFLRRR